MKGFGKTTNFKLYPAYHQGIDRFVSYILTSISAIQFVLKNPVALVITNDIPGDPQERSLGLTEAQISELKEWLDTNRSRLPPNLEIYVLQASRPKRGSLWLNKNFHKSLLKL
jgi:hypothetical protein